MLDASARRGARPSSASTCTACEVDQGARSTAPAGEVPHRAGHAHGPAPSRRSRPGERVHRRRRATRATRAPMPRRRRRRPAGRSSTDGVIVAGQPHGAPSWFPATTGRPTRRPTGSTSRPPPATASSPTARLRRATPRRASATTWVYEQPRADGDLPRDRADRPLRSSRPPTARRCRCTRRAPARLASRRTTTRSAASREMIDVLRRGSSGRYPFAGYTVVVTDDDLEIPLESQALSTFGANFLTADWDAERLVAHELAHQWFGNSLTARALAATSGCTRASPATPSGCGRRSRAGRSAARARRASTGDAPRRPAAGPRARRPGPGADVRRPGLQARRAAAARAAPHRRRRAFFAMLRAWADRHQHATVSTAAFVDCSPSCRTGPRRALRRLAQREGTATPAPDDRQAPDPSRRP